MSDVITGMTGKQYAPLDLSAPQSALEEATALIHGDREQTYGHPSKNLTNIAQQWRLYMLQKYGADVDLSAEDVCWMMADLKKARQMNVYKRDNLVDAIGYVGLVERVQG